MGTVRACDSCKHPMDRDDLQGVPDPYTNETRWYCRHLEACTERTKQRLQTELAKEHTMTLPQHSRFASYVPPVNPDSDTYKPYEHYGNHAICKVLEYKPEVVTPNSPNGAPAVIVDVYDLNEKAAFRNVLMMTGAIVDGFKPHVGGPPLVIQWEKTVGNSGRSYARPAPAVPAAIEAAEAVYAAGDPFADKLGTIGEEAPF